MKHFSFWTTKDSTALLHELGTSTQGLSSQEAHQRLAQYGHNLIDIKDESPITLLIRQLKSPFNSLLLGATTLELFIGEYTNSALILILTLINICIGFFQEYKAHRAIILLRRYIPSMTTVMRHGKPMRIAKDLLVPGDIIVLGPNSVVPADARVIQGTIIVDESTLTGEAEPAIKSREPLAAETQEIFQAKNIVFAGTSIMSGTGLAVVIATGNGTIFYTITAGGSSSQKLSSYEKSLLNVSRVTLHFVILTVAIIFIIKQLIHANVSMTDELVFFITLIVAIVPEALPTVVAFSLSQGALKLAKNQVVVKRLTAIDDLGDIEILCTDKTGTITELHLSVDAVVSDDPKNCLLFLLMDTLIHANGTICTGVFDDVLLNYADQTLKDTLKRYAVLGNIPFDSFRMRITLLVQDEQGRRFLIAKGAPDVLLELSSSVDSSLSIEQMKEKIEAYGREGKRTLGVAYKQIYQDTLDPELEKDLNFLGFIALNNPIKKGVITTLELAKKLGLKVKMITGDSKEVTGFVGKQIGLVSHHDEVITGAELAQLQSAEFKEKCLKYSLFARIDPKTKANIISSLQEFHEVGFMGEGINDVPALKKANVAIVVQEASDVARAVSDIVLLKRDLHVIVSGIAQGRITFSNINKYIKCTLSGNFGNYYSLAFFSLLVPFLPMLPTQILLINLLSDFPLISIASDRVDAYQIRRPKTYSITTMLPLIFLLGFVGTLSDIIFFALFYNQSPDMFRSLWFLLNILSNIILIYSVRTSNFFLYGSRPSWLLMLASCISLFISLILPYSTLGQAWFSFVGPTMPDLAKVFGIVIIYGIMTEFVKVQYTKYMLRPNNKAGTPS